MTEPLNIDVSSEVGRLQAVILHRPGPEVQSMTPATAARALYSDILNLAVAGREYDQLEGVLKRCTRTFQLKDLLTDILADRHVKESLVQRICAGKTWPNWPRQSSNWTPPTWPAPSSRACPWCGTT